MSGNWDKGIFAYFFALEKSKGNDVLRKIHVDFLTGDIDSQFFL